MGIRVLSAGIQQSACGGDRSSQSNINGNARNSVSTSSYFSRQCV